MSTAYDRTNLKKPLDGRFSIGMLLDVQNRYGTDYAIVSVKQRMPGNAFPTNSGSTPLTDWERDNVPKRLLGTLPGEVDMRFHAYVGNGEPVMIGGDPVIDSHYIMLREARAIVKTLEIAEKGNHGEPLAKILGVAKALGCEWYATPGPHWQSHRMYSDTDWTYRPVESIVDDFVKRTAPLLADAKARAA